MYNEVAYNEVPYNEVPYNEVPYNEVDEVLDESWIKEFEETDKLYEKYYLDDLYNVKINFVYVDALKNIIKVKEETYLMKKLNWILKEELTGILKKNSEYNNEKYTIQSILKYNIDIEPNDIYNFLKKNLNRNFLSTVNHIDDVFFHKSISLFQDMNALYFIFVIKDNEKRNQTKRININRKNAKKTMRK